MTFAVIVSTKDPAGMNIRECLIRLFDFKEIEDRFDDNTVFLKNNIKLYTTSKDSIYCENIDEKIEGDIIIFATKHASANNVHSLSVHTQGNWNRAELGGKERQLCVCPAALLKLGMIELEKQNKNQEYEIIQECTHHGPFLAKKPSMFIEIGSDEKQWKDKEAGNAVARTVINIIDKYENEKNNYKSALGIGGLHHTPSFKRIITETNIAIGHVCPKYMLEFLDKEMILQALEKTTPKAELVIVDWKGLGMYKEKVKNILNEIGVEWKKTKEVK